MKIKYTERMIREATIAEEKRIDKTAPEMTLYAFNYIKNLFKENADIYLWYDAKLQSILDYLAGKYAIKNDELRDEKQRKVCFDALKFIEDRRNNGYLEANLNWRFDRILSAIYILSMFIPGQHLGFTISGSALNRYLITGFGGTLEKCGKYGFGIRILEASPEYILHYIRDILEQRKI